MIIAPLLVVGCSFFKSSKDIKLIPYAQKDKYGYFDLEGKIVINPQFAYATAFREDIALVKTTGDKGKWGYIDKKGSFLIPPEYDNAYFFKNGIGKVTLSGKSFYIDNKNRLVKNEVIRKGPENEK